MILFNADIRALTDAIVIFESSPTPCSGGVDIQLLYNVSSESD